jgi:hypothetical protein
MRTDADGDGVALVLKGGHRKSGAKGEEPGESYYVDREGYYKTSDPGVELGMSFLRKLPLDISDYGRPSVG